MAASISKQSLEDLRRLTSTLYHIISPLYGPKSQQTLLVTSTGKVIISCDGQTVMSSLHLSHPTARCILESVATHSSTYGDGTKCHVVYLYELIKAISHTFQTQRMFDSEEVYRCGVSRWLSEFMSFDIPYIIEDMKYLIMERNKSLNSQHAVHKIIQDLIHSSLSCSLVNMNISNLVSICTSFLLDSSTAQNDVCQNIQRSYSQFDNMVFRVVGMPFESSFLCNGFHASGKIVRNVDGHGNLICLNCPFEHVKDNELPIYNTDPDSHISENIIFHKLKIVEEFLFQLKASGIGVILTAERVPSYVLQLCFKLGMNIGMLDDISSLEYFTLVGDCSAVTSFSSNDFSANSVEIESFDSIRYGTKDYVKITFPGQSEVFNHHTLFLCAPTDSAASQLKFIFRKITKVLDYCLCNTDTLTAISEKEQSISEPHKSTYDLSLGSSETTGNENKSELSMNKLKAMLLQNALPGGGVFEMMLQQCLDKYFVGKFSQQKSLCCDFMRKMLGGVPDLLIDSTPGSKMHGSSISSLQVKENKETFVSDTPQVFDYCGQQQGIDFMDIKVATVFSTLQLVVRLLRIDSIVPVKQINVLDNTLQSSSDEEES